MEPSVHKCIKNNDLDMSLPGEKYITPKLYRTTLQANLDDSRLTTKESTPSDMLLQVQSKVI